MARHDRVPFDKGGDFTARRSFKFQNHSFSTGDKFPWRRICCSPRKLKLLFDGGFITLPVEAETKYDAPKAAKKPAKKKKAKKTVEEKPEVEDAPVETKDEADYDIEKFLTDQD